jgi:hypothetical protein
MRLITYGGRTQNLAAWAKEIGIFPVSCQELFWTDRVIVSIR